MKFRFRGVVPALGLHGGGVAPVVFSMAGDPPVRVELRNGEKGVQLLCDVTAETEPLPAVRGAFESLAAGHLPAGSLPPEKWSKPLAQLDRSGQIRGSLRSVPMQYLPQGFQQYVDDLLATFSDAASRAVGLLRWRSGHLGPQSPISRRGSSWSLGDGEWHSFPAPASVTLVHNVLLELHPSAHDDLQRLQASGEYEPFTYGLIREAWGQYSANPSSSLLVAIAALELAVQQFITDRVERATWLAEEMPSPDVIRLLDEYLPYLDPPPGAPSSASRLEPLPSQLLELLRTRRNQRNAIAHRPESPTAKPLITSEHARSAVLGVRQVLLRLDLAQGHAWAAGYLLQSFNEEPSSGWRRVS